MRKILVLATGWHFSSHFYEEMIKQKVPKGWEVDYYNKHYKNAEKNKQRTIKKLRGKVNE